MSIFGKILAGLGIGEKPAAPPTPQAAQASSPSASDAGLDAMLRDAAAQNRTDPSLANHTSDALTPAPIAKVDVAAKLDALVQAAEQSLNWRSSIVDLLKVLKLDSSLEARKALALELGCPHEKLADSSQMNIWLHQQVMQKLAENGGEVPENLR